MTTVADGGGETAVHMSNEARRRFSRRNRADAQSQRDDGTALEDQVDSDEKPNGPKAREGPASEKETSKDRAHESVEHVKPFALDVRGQRVADPQNPCRDEIKRDHQRYGFSADRRPRHQNQSDDAEQNGPQHMDEKVGPIAGERKRESKDGDGADEEQYAEKTDRELVGVI